MKILIQQCYKKKYPNVMKTENILNLSIKSSTKSKLYICSIYMYTAHCGYLIFGIPGFGIQHFSQCQN